MVRGRGKIVIKEVIEKAIKNGHVSGDKIVFRLKDITAEDGSKKGVIKCCMRRSRFIFGVVKDKKNQRQRLYYVDYSIVQCYGDDKLIEMFKKKLEEKRD